MANPLGAVVGVVAAGAAASKLLGGSTGGISSALPAPNVLSNYASYNYVVSLSSMSAADLNFPDSTYKQGKRLPLICKTAGADPENRVKTSFGKHDYYLDNISIDTTIGLQDFRATNVTIVQFDVFEPYSIGQFMLALQTAAYSAKFRNFRDAPYLLAIEFRGNKESGQISNIPFAARHIPIRISTITMKSTESGTRYNVTAYAVQGQALTTEFANLKTDVALKGKTVQEVLQTGEQSLQNIVNRKLKEHQVNDVVKVADQIVILFPKEEALPSSAVASPSTAQQKATTTIVQGTDAATDVFKKIGVNKVNLAQGVGDINLIGQSSMGYDLARRADTAPKEVVAGVTFDEKSNTWTRGNMTVDPKEGVLKFSQHSDIPAVINQILLTSQYPETSLAAANLKDGMRTWWRIDTQVFYVETDENLDNTGTYPRVIVYRIVPYKAHAGALPPVNEKVPGQDAIRNQIVKRYDYIYTGKNSEIIKFDIDFSVGFANVLTADDNRDGGDYNRRKKTGLSTSEKPKEVRAFTPGSPPSENSGSIPGQSKPKNADPSKPGGGGAETPITRAGKAFHDAITNVSDMMILNMEVWGDPYWIAHSGQGNYTSKPVIGVKDLNEDGSVNWQSGEVDILVNFRSPIDINQSTGMYDFKGPNHMDMSLQSKAGPVLGFTGLYIVKIVKNYFRQGKFTQVLTGSRRQHQGEDSKVDASPAEVLNTTDEYPPRSEPGA